MREEKSSGSAQLMVTMRVVGLPVSEMVALSDMEGAGDGPVL